MAWLNKKLGNLDSAYENYLRSNYWYRQTGLLEYVGDGLKNIGNILRDVNEFDKAYQYYFDALDIYSDLKLDSKIINTNRSISLCKIKEKDYTDSFKYAKRALTKSINNQDEKYINIAHNLIGIIYYETGDYFNARKSYFNSIEKIVNLKNKTEVLAIAFNNIGETYREEGNFIKAHEYFDKALLQKRKLQNSALTASTLLNIGKLYIIENNYIGAIRSLEEAISLMDENRIDENLTEAITEITNAYNLAISQGLQIDISEIFAYNRLLHRQFSLIQRMRNELVEQHNEYMLDKSFEKQALQANIGQLQNTKLYLIWAGVLIITVFLFLIFLMNRALKKAQHKSREIVQTLNQMKGVLGDSFQRMSDDDTFTIITKK